MFGIYHRMRFRCVFDKNAIVLLKFRLFQLINNLFVNSMPKFFTTLNQIHMAVTRLVQLLITRKLFKRNTLYPFQLLY